MKNLLNSMKKQGGKLIIQCFVRYWGEKPPKPWLGKTGRKTWYWLIEGRGETFWIKSLSTTSKSGATKSIAAMQHANFCLSYWLFCLDGHAFVLVLWGPLAWPLVEQSPGVKKLLLASPDALYRRCWSVSRDVWLPMKAPRCFFLLNSPSTK